MAEKKLVFITAPWCATCRQVKPLAEKLCEARGIKMEILDMVLQEAECAEYNPTTLPFLVYGDNAVCGGACTRAGIEAVLNA